jgi:cytochrome c biogenesis protein CcmG, thiol:disulfide interchange protein DsbE
MVTVKTRRVLPELMVARMADSLVTSQQTPSKKSLPVWVIFIAGVALLGFLVFLVLGLVNSRQQSLALGSRIDDFTITTFDGKDVSLSSLHGKTVLVNFWASWCTTCIDEAPMLEEAWQKVESAGQVVFIGVDYADSQPAARAFLQKYSIDYMNGPDLGLSLSQQFHITGVPETYLIGGDGTLSAIKIGPFSSTDELLTFLDQKSGN